MSTTLPLFWHLSSSSKKERIDASVKLVDALQQFQTQFVPKTQESPEESSDEEAEEADGIRADGLDALNAQDVSYSIRRLVRGLASPRESSRLGFAVALTELLSRLDTITCTQIVSLIIDASSSQGSSMTGQEERDMLFARLFGLTSVIQSGLLTRTIPLPTSTTTPSTATSYQEVLNQLVLLGEKKSWLRESAWWTMLLAIGALHESEVPWKAEAVQATFEVVYEASKDWSPEKVAVTLKLQELHPNHDWRTTLASSFKNPDLLSASNLGVIARILKESTIEEEADKSAPKTAAGSWKPQLHFVWDIILDQLLPGPNSPSAPKGSFQEFFRVVVDESLFSATSSPERKYWGFQVFQKALPRIDEAAMPLLFTKNFMRSWINHLSHNDRYLHKVAKQVAADIQSFVQSNPTLGFTLILQLTGGNGNRQFDKITKTKTVESVLAAMDADGIKSYIKYLLTLVNSDETNEIQVVNSRRAWIIDQLVALIRNGSIPKSDEWIQSILDWLVVHGLFVVRKKSEKSGYLALHSLPSPAFSDELRQNCRSKLLMTLADLTSQTTVVKSGEKSTKVPSVSSTGEFWVSRVLSTIEALEKDTKHVTLLGKEEVDEEDLALRAQARSLSERLRNISIGASGESPQQQADAAKGAELLIAATLLQQYCASEEEEDGADTDILEACIDGANRMFPPESKKSSSKKSRKSAVAAAAEDDAPEAVDVLVDTIIGFLEKSTAYMRTVGNQVFALLSGAVKESTIDLVLTQLEKRDPAELVEDSDEDDEMEVEVDGEGEGDEDDEDDDEESDIEIEEEDSGDDEVEDLELRRKIEEALRVNGIEEASNSDESDEDLMDDDQMLAIDHQLAAVFRSRANEKKSGKDVDAQREATHFKNRVLDLVDTFVKKQPGSAHILRLILPLVDLIAGTGSDERQLAEKATGILRSRIGKLKEVPTDVDLAQCCKVLEDIHLQARRAHSSEALATLSQCSLYVTKCMLHAGDSTAGSKAILDAYRTSLKDFLSRKNSSLNYSFLQDFFRRYPLMGWELRRDLLELSASAANAYRRCQAFQLLQLSVTHAATIAADHTPEAVEFFTLLHAALSEILSSASTDKIILTTAQMKELLKLALLSARQTKRVVPAQTEQIWQPASWLTLRSALSSSDRFKESTALQAMCQQMSQAVVAVKAKKEKKKEKSKDGEAKEKKHKGSSSKRKADDAEEVAPTKKKRKSATKGGEDVV